MEEQIIDVESTEVVEDIQPPTKSRDEIKKDLEELRKLNKQLKKIKRYIKSPLHAVRQMDARSGL